MLSFPQPLGTPQGLGNLLSSPQHQGRRLLPLLSTARIHTPSVLLSQVPCLIPASAPQASSVSRPHGT